MTAADSKTVSEIIVKMDDLIPNAVPEKVKVEWIAELDGKIALEIALMSNADSFNYSANYPERVGWQVLLAFPWDCLYEHYLRAQIDFANGEYEKYDNSMTMFNNQLDEFKKFYLNAFMPAFPRLVVRDRGNGRFV